MLGASAVLANPFAGASDPDPVVEAATTLTSTFDALRSAESTAAAAEAALVAAGTAAGELTGDDRGAAPVVDPVVVALQDVYAEQRTALATLVADRVGVDPVELEAAWAATGDQRFHVMLAALTQLGKPYAWGSEGPDAFDCSGFTRWAWGTQLVELPHWSLGQANSGEAVDPSTLQVGDLVHAPGHIMLSLGLADAVIEATTTRTGGVQLGNFAGRADAFTDPLQTRTVRWRVKDPVRNDPTAGAVAPAVISAVTPAAAAIPPAPAAPAAPADAADADAPVVIPGPVDTATSDQSTDPSTAAPAVAAVP